MGRIEAHYRKFPDHFRKLPPSPEDPKQSYSALKTLSDPAKPGGGEGSEINKSVLSPTPGTPASETHGEPGLPMETLTPQLRHPQEDPAPGDLAGGNLAPVEPQEPPARGRPGRGRRRGRGRKGRRGRPARVVPPTTAPNIQSPTRILEKILSVYTPQDIQGAVGHRLYQDLSPWQLLCLRVDREGASLWQDRLRILEDLLRECREEFHSQTEPLARPTSYREGTHGGCMGVWQGMVTPCPLPAVTRC
ncbi:hypothetical protein GWK47_052295 [Chionoecetes opilio]|uniref:Uncharacterized protein n=1 Tax=Chionoecetes opilio TaxID=41210 RepID=A0A8J4Y6M4_CHIOP|nr:hypothetical protein GWK47_052295 [Chionoecetes opilio]